MRKENGGSQSRAGVALSQPVDFLALLSIFWKMYSPLIPVKKPSFEGKRCEGWEATSEKTVTLHSAFCQQIMLILNFSLGILIFLSRTYWFFVCYHLPSFVKHHFKEVAWNWRDFPLVSWFSLISRNRFFYFVDPKMGNCLPRLLSFGRGNMEGTPMRRFVFHKQTKFTTPGFRSPSTSSTSSQDGPMSFSNPMMLSQNVRFF